MKKWLQVLVTLVFAICSMVLINAQGVEAADKITSTDGQWEYEADYFNNTCTVRAYMGDAVDLVIPSKIDGLTVTKIETGWDKVWGEYAGLPKNIVSVSIPSTVSVIGSHSFSGLKNLRDVNLPSKLEEIGDYAFYECESLEDIRIPKSVSYIDVYAFAYSGIKKLVIEGNPEFMISGGGACFMHCKNLEYVSMPEYKGGYGVEPLFHDCTSLKEVNMPKVQVIPQRCFLDCQSLEKIKLPSCLKGIGASAFKGTSLKNVDLPDTLNSLGQYAFSGTKLSSLVIPYGVSDVVWVGDLSNIDIYVLNPECQVGYVSQTCTIYGFKDSEAYECAKRGGIRFVQLKGISSVKASRKGNARVFSWKKVSGVKSYTIFRYNYEKKSYQKIATTKKKKYTDKSKSASDKYMITYQFKKNGKTLTGGFPVSIY